MIDAVLIGLRRRLDCYFSLLWKRNINRRGRTFLRIRGKINGKIYLGYHYGLWTFAPSFLQVGPGATLNIRGRAYFYGDNTIRIEENAVVTIGNNTRVNIKSSLNAQDRIEIGEQCLIAERVHIRDNDGHEIAGVIRTKPVKIGDRVWIGYGAIVLKGVTIGDGSVVAAGSIVTSDVPESAIVAGNPARVIKTGIDWKV